MSDSDNAADFSAFEAAANAGEPVSKEPEAPATKEVKQPEPGNGEPLELTDGMEAVDVPDDEEGGEQSGDGERRRRSKPASQRIVN